MKPRTCSKCGGEGPFPPKGKTCIACKKAYWDNWYKKHRTEEIERGKHNQKSSEAIQRRQAKRLTPRRIIVNKRFPRSFILDSYGLTPAELGEGQSENREF